MWIDSGPISIVPVDGDGKVATRLDIAPHSALSRSSRSALCADARPAPGTSYAQLNSCRQRVSRSTGSGGLEKYSRGQVGLAAALDELEREVEVDLRVLSQLDGHERLVAGLSAARRPARR